MRKKQILKDSAIHFTDLIEVAGESLYEKRGKWRSLYENDAPLWIELGTGRGAYLTELARIYPNRNFLGTDIKIDRLVQAAKKIKGLELHNLHLAQINYRDLSKIFAAGELAGCIVNFPEPRIKPGQAWWRVTHPDTLNAILPALGIGAEVWFKSDDPFFWEWSKPFLDDVLTIEEETSDFEAAPLSTPEPFTEYHLRWLKEGKAIFALRGRVKKIRCDVSVTELTWKEKLDAPKK